MDDDAERRARNRQAFLDAQHRADQSGARYDHAMEQSYLDPQAAAARMNTFAADHGPEALHDKLTDNPRKTAFGRRPGSILSLDGYTDGAGERRETSILARHRLPDIVQAHHIDQAALEAARQAPGALDGPPMPPDPYTLFGAGSAAPAGSAPRMPEHELPPDPYALLTTPSKAPTPEDERQPTHVPERER